MDLMTEEQEIDQLALKLAEARAKSLLGRNVIFKGAIWRVVATKHREDHQGRPWVTLVRPFVQALAKEDELKLITD